MNASSSHLHRSHYHCLPNLLSSLFTEIYKELYAYFNYQVTTAQLCSSIHHYMTLSKSTIGGFTKLVFFNYYLYVLKQK